MTGTLHRRAIQRLIDRATTLGITVPAEIRALTRIDHSQNLGALLWTKANPDRADETFGCCYGDALDGATRCTCWTPVFDLDQAAPIPPACPDDLHTRNRACNDCAFRKDSPERADPFTAEELLNLAPAGETFWCHDGMRRPTHWQHPDGRTIPGSDADWQPAILAGIPYRADGRPGLLCASWAAHAARHTNTPASPSPADQSENRPGSHT